MPAYVAALRRQLAQARAWATENGLHLPQQVDTVYLGGGTPSLLPPELLFELFAAIRQEFAVDPDAEITLEAAPLQLAPATLEAAQRVGVNRISFGVQSFIDSEARATARTHSGAQALAELERMRAAGVPHVSADLIAGLPGQTGATWARSVATLASAPVNHASLYMFELDEDSRLGAEALRGGLRFGAALLPHDDAVADWYLQACETLADAGLTQYEISNFARSGLAACGKSRHNERYWLRAPYLGLGVDAHSMLHGREGSAPARFATGDELQPFLDKPAWTQAETESEVEPETESWTGPERLTPTQELEEAWFLGLRRTAGVSLPALRQQFGPEAVTLYEPALRDLTDAGLVTLSPDNRVEDQFVALTPRGRLLSNDVFAALLAASETSQAVPA